MASIVKRNKSYAVVYTDTTGERKRQKWETYYSLTEAEQRKELLELCASARTEARCRQKQTVAGLLYQYIELHGVSRWSPSTYQANCSLRDCKKPCLIYISAQLCISLYSLKSRGFSHNQPLHNSITLHVSQY